jgi:ribosomal protein L9
MDLYCESILRPVLQNLMVNISYRRLKKANEQLQNVGNYHVIIKIHSDLIYNYRVNKQHLAFSQYMNIPEK